MNKIPETELILNSDGSVYHLNLLPGDIANTIYQQESGPTILILFTTNSMR
jgi:hypothetical protein